MPAPRLLFVLLLCASKLFPQESFTLEFTFPTVSGGISNIRGLEASAENISLLLDFGGPGFSILDLNNNGEINSFFDVAPQDGSTWRSLPLGYNANANYHIGMMRKNALTGEPATGIFVVSPSTGVAWAKQLSTRPLRLERSDFIGENTLLSSHFLLDPGDDEQLLQLILFDLVSGNPIWSKSYIAPDGIPRLFFIRQILELPNGNAAVLVTTDVTNGEERETFLLELGSSGGLIKSVTPVSSNRNIELQSITADPSGNLYFIGSIRDVSSNYSDALILKLNGDLEFEWSKVLTAENFPYFESNLMISPDGNLLFSYATNSDFPVIAGFISPDGALLNYDGYSGYEPLIGITPSLSFLISSNRKYTSANTWSDTIILTRTLAGGGLQDCNIYPSCLEAIDFPVDIMEVQWSIEDIAIEPTNIPISLAQNTAVATEICNTPPPPTAHFSIPDSLCLGEVLEPSELENALAQTQRWQLSSKLLDTVFTDKTFSFVPNTPGAYTLTQEIWTLGCSYTHNQDIVVLDPSRDLLGEDRIICEAPPFILTPITNLPPNSSYHWSNGATTPEISIQQSGSYYISVEDSFCQYQDSVQLTFLEDVTEPSTQLTIPNDTIICAEALPFSLVPNSLSSSLFELVFDNQLIQGDSFLLEEPGFYWVTTEVLGCEISQSFLLELDDCRDKVYLPNTFSPNNDGVNDFLFPQGVDFEMIELQVFDRWGSLLYSTPNDPFRWDGTYGTKPVSQGTYLVHLVYRNLKTGAIVSRTYDVVVLK